MNKPDRIQPYQISNYITDARTMSFKDWLDIPIIDDYTHNDYIIHFIDGLMEVIYSSGYKIEDEKQFRNEIAVYVYRLSKET